MRSLGLAADILAANFREPALPFKLTLVVTYRCQLRCNMCAIWERQPEGELGLEEIRTFLRKGRFSWVNLTGGEIFLREDVDGIFRAVVEACPRLYLLDFPTHGFQTRRVVASVETLVRSPIPRIFVTVSLDGPRDLHDRIRGIEGSFDRAVETFARLRAIRRPGFRTFLGMTLQEANVDSVDATLAAVREQVPGVRPRDLHVNLGHVSAHYYGNEGFRPAAPVSAGRALERVRKLRGLPLHPVEWIERRYAALAQRYLHEGRTPLPCHALGSSVFVDSYGDVFPCSIWGRRLGNLRDHGLDLASLLRANGAAAVRADARRKRCPNCWTPCEAFPTILSHLRPRAGDAP